jgi:adenylosuccinate synthase
VTSSNTTAGFATTGTGLGPRAIDYVLGIVKTYTTRVGGGPFPTELHDATGEYLQRVGHEFGAVTGRRRRCGWLDAIALRRSLINSSVSGLCLTKLDVLDALDEIKICVGYKSGGRLLQEPPLSTEEFAAVEAVYETLPGWRASTVGITERAQLPENARRYLDRIAALVDTPIDVISTGPDRAQTIVLRHPFDN